MAETDSKDILLKLKSSLKAFSDITGLPVTTYYQNGDIATEYNPEKKLCSELSVYSLKNGGCRKLLFFAGEFSSHLGEPYIFLCRAGFSNIAVPIIFSGVFRGYAVAGPFIMKKLRSSTLKNMLGMNRMDEEKKKLMTDFAKSMPAYSSSQITDLSLLLYNCVLSVMVTSRDYSNLNRQNEEQRTMSSKIRAAKNEAFFNSSFNEDTENKLVDYILKNDQESAEKLIRRILDGFSVICVGNLDEIKTMSLWATANIVRSLAKELRTRFGETLDVDIDIMNRITEAESLEDLVKAFMYITDYVSGSLEASLYTGSSTLVSSSLRYIKEHYREKLTLKDMCLELHVNPTYFSYLFSREMGQSFVDFLTDIRLGKASDLLSNTSLSIMDVSVMSGFENQSYFTKVFRTKKGLTPREFRNAQDKKQ